MHKYWIVGAVGGWFAAGALAQLESDPTVLSRVEEDWQAVLNEPAAELVAPQFHTIMTPFGSTTELHFQACWNFREMPEFASGGLQIMAYRYDNLAGSKAFRSDLMSTAAETLSWTQSMRVSGNTLTFKIKNGSSATWGAFGGAESSLTGLSPAPDFSTYSPDVSRENTWISYGANRVQLLQITETRLYDQDGNLVSTDTTPRVVYQASSDD